jgi:hypothetical protein
LPAEVAIIDITDPTKPTWKEASSPAGLQNREGRTIPEAHTLLVQHWRHAHHQRAGHADDTHNMSASTTSRLPASEVHPADRLRLANPARVFRMEGPESPDALPDFQRSRSGDPTLRV